MSCARLETVNIETKKPKEQKIVEKEKKKGQKQISHSHAIEDAPLRLDMNCLTFHAFDVDYEK